MNWLPLCVDRMVNGCRRPEEAAHAGIALLKYLLDVYLTSRHFGLLGGAETPH